MTPWHGGTRRWLFLMAILATVSACNDAVAPRTLKVPDASTIIVDGAHNNGNDDVFFLPPLVADPTGTVGFGDPEQLGLPVEIQVNCQSHIANSTCPNFDFPPSQVKSSSDAHYMVNWDTKAPGVDPGDVYRIEIHIGQKTVAWADVALVTNGNPKNVATQDDIVLQDGRTLPIKVRIEKGWDCTNRSTKNQCVTQVVPNVAVDGSGSTIIQFAGTDLEPAGGGRFYDGWIPYSDTCRRGSTTCVPTGTPVVVTVEDQTSLLNGSGATCGLKDPQTGVPVTTMLTQLGSGETQHPGRCVKFTTNPRFTFAKRVDVAVCVESPTPTQQLLKYDVGETPRFLQNVFFPIVCEPSTIGSTMRTRSSNRILNYALNSLVRAGDAVSQFFTPKSAYAIHLGVGGLIGDGDGGFSFVAPAEPYTMTKVSGDGQTGTVGTSVAGPRSRITTVHPSLAPAVGQNVRCEITSGGGSLGSLGGPTQVVVQTQAVRNEAGAIIDAVATCPDLYLGPSPGTNTMRMVALNIDDGIVASEDNGEGGVQTEILHGIQTFSATATALAGGAGGNEFVIVGDANIFDNSGATDDNNKQLFRNLVSYSTDALRGSSKNVLVFCGHNSTFCSPGTTFESVLGQIGYTVTRVTSPTAGLTPVDENTKVILVVLPDSPFTEAEVGALQDFANTGGRIVLVSDYPTPASPTSLAAVNSLRAGFGYPPQPASNNRYACTTSTDPRVVIPGTQIFSHQITTNLQQLTVECGSEVPSLGESSTSLFYATDAAGGVHTMGVVAPVPVPSP